MSEVDIDCRQIGHSRSGSRCCIQLLVFAIVGTIGSDVDEEVEECICSVEAVVLDPWLFLSVCVLSHCVLFGLVLQVGAWVFYYQLPDVLALKGRYVGLEEDRHLLHYRVYSSFARLTYYCTM